MIKKQALFGTENVTKDFTVFFDSLRNMLIFAPLTHHPCSSRPAWPLQVCIISEKTKTLKTMEKLSALCFFILFIIGRGNNDCHTRFAGTDSIIMIPHIRRYQISIPPISEAKATGHTMTCCIHNCISGKTTAGRQCTDCGKPPRKSLITLLYMYSILKNGINRSKSVIKNHIFF